MTTTSLQKSDRSRARDLPTWLTVLVVLACLLAGGALVWWYLRTPQRVAVIPLADQPRQASGRAATSDNNRSGRAAQYWNNDVRPGVGNSFEVRAGNVLMWVRPRESRPEPSLRLEYRGRSVSREQMNLMRSPLLANREDQARRLKLTNDQIEALKKIRSVRGGMPMVIGKEDEQQILAAWMAFQKADESSKPINKEALLKVLESQGKKNFEASKTALNQSITAVRSILNAEQQAMMESGRF
jgi:hypothetical protein